MSISKRASLINAKIVLLRKLLDDVAHFEEGKILLLQVHSLLHTQAMTHCMSWSYQDELLLGLSESNMRTVPEDEDHSIVWLLWHLTRCEDITMNLLIARSDQVLVGGGWQEKLSVPWRDTGNIMTRQEIEAFSKMVDILQLLEYRMSVGRTTQAIIKKEIPETIHQKVKSEDIDRIYAEGAVCAEAHSIVDYWSNRDHAGLYLMPATRHILTHLNETQKIRKKVLRIKHD